MEYDRVYSTTRQVFDDMLYEPPGKIEDKEGGEKNDPKDGDRSMKKRNMSASVTSIQHSSTWTNRILQIQNILNMNFLTVNASIKLNGEYLGILSKSLTIT